jgi:acyl carrier protein
MNRQQIISELTTIFRNLFDNDTITLFDEMTANDIKTWDSLNHINLIIAAEKQFKIRFSTSEIIGLANVGQFVDAIMKKVNP